MHLLEIHKQMGTEACFSKAAFYANYLPSLNSVPVGKVAVIMLRFGIVLFIQGDYSQEPVEGRERCSLLMAGAR